jgi:hypothetical protein
MGFWGRERPLAENQAILPKIKGNSRFKLFPEYFLQGFVLFTDLYRN